MFLLFLLSACSLLGEMLDVRLSPGSVCLQPETAAGCSVQRCITRTAYLEGDFLAMCAFGNVLSLVHKSLCTKCMHSGEPRAESTR
jgi:hypothetical protein